MGSAEAIGGTVGFSPKSNWNLSRCFGHGVCLCV